MRALISAAMDRSRTTLLTFLFLVLGGTAAYQAIPKESNPDVTIPMIYVAMVLDGISPEDAERLLVRPMEQELRSLEGIKEMRSTSAEGHASVMLEFDAGLTRTRPCRTSGKKWIPPAVNYRGKPMNPGCMKSMSRCSLFCLLACPGRCLNAS